MDALSAALGALARRRRLRDEGQQAWEARCARALSRSAAAAERAAAAAAAAASAAAGPGSAATGTASTTATAAADEGEHARVCAALRAFYAVHNPGKLGEVETVARHFRGRLGALNDALLAQYGHDLGACGGAAGGAEQQSRLGELAQLRGHARRLRGLFLEAVQELHLPRREFQVRSCGETSMLGVKDAWLEQLSGQVRLDLCLRAGGSVEAALRTVKPVTLRCRVSGVKSVDGVRLDESADAPAAAGHVDTRGLGKVFELDALSVDADVSFDLAFVFDARGRSWAAAPGFRFELARLRTDRPMADAVVRSVVNAAVPQALQRALAPALPAALAQAMLHPRVVALNSSHAPMGLALLLKLHVSGWPAAADFGLPLHKVPGAGSGSAGAARGAAEVLKRLRIDARQLAALKCVNDEAAKARAPDAAQPGLLPLKEMTLEQLFAMHRGLYVGDLVHGQGQRQGRARRHGTALAAGDDTDDDDLRQSPASDEGEQHEATDGDDSERELLPAATDDEEEEEEDESEAEHAPKPQPAQPPLPNLQQPRTRARLNAFKNAEDSEEFAREYGQVVACAARAQQWAQEQLDAACAASGQPSFSLAELAERVGRVVGCKDMRVELEIDAVDVRLDADVALEEMQTALFLAVKSSKGGPSRGGGGADQRRAALRSLHSGFLGAKLALSAFKALAGSSQLSVTGVVSGGRAPAFELSVRDARAEGVLDVQLGSMRLGGLFDDVVGWFARFATELGSAGVMGPRERRASQRAVRETKRHLLRNLELLQFMLDLRCLKSSANSLIVALGAQKDNPRPALSLHLTGDLVELLERASGAPAKAKAPARGAASAVHAVSSDAFSALFPGGGSDDKARVPGAALAAALEQASGKTVHPAVVELAAAVMLDPSLARMPLSLQDGFFVLGFVHSTLARAEPHALLVHDDGAQTEDESEGE